jgi:predicted enzyme related to lactoylglutathione lyase
MLQIKLTSIMVEDQTKALSFYTDVLGFEKRMDFPVGEYRWITVAASGRDDLQLALEPNANPAAKAFQQAMFAQGIPLASFESTDLDADYARLRDKGVAFTRAPAVIGAVKVAIFSDTVGNLIQLHQPVSNFDLQRVLAGGPLRGRVGYVFSGRVLALVCRRAVCRRDGHYPALDCRSSPRDPRRGRCRARASVPSRARAQQGRRAAGSRPRA